MRGKWAAPILLAVIVAAVVALLAGDPGQHKIVLSLDDRRMHQSELDTQKWAEELLASPVARFLDPDGHDRVAHALDIERRGRTLEELGPGTDIFLTTNEHQIAVHNLKWSLLVYLGMIFAGTLLGYLLWLRDSRSGLWIAASVTITLAPMITAFIAVPAFPLPGIAVFALWLSAMGTVGRESLRAMRLRTPDEIK